MLRIRVGVGVGVGKDLGDEEGDGDIDSGGTFRWGIAFHRNFLPLFDAGEIFSSDTDGLSGNSAWSIDPLCCLNSRDRGEKKANHQQYAKHHSQ